MTITAAIHLRIFEVGITESNDLSLVFSLMLYALPESFAIHNVSAVVTVANIVISQYTVAAYFPIHKPGHDSFIVT